MKRELCVLFLVCLAVVLVQSKTSIEYDENGDEIEVKRFYIEGRQVNGGRRQCVETRRKRQASYHGNNGENAHEENTGKKKTDGLELSPTTPATGIDTATSEDESANNNDNHRIGLIGILDDSNHHIGIDDEDDDVEDLEDTYHDIPVKAHKQHSSSSHSATAAVAGPNGIVVVHTNSPPKVNPQTHAVFQLMPAQASSLIGTNDYDDDDIDNSQLYYEEEISPVSTTAIWSTGADDDLDDIEDHIPGDHDDYDEDGVDGGDDGGNVGGNDAGNDGADDGGYDVDGGYDGDDDEDDYDLEEVHPVATKKPKTKPAKGSSRPVKNGGGKKKKKQNKTQKQKRPSTHKRRRPGNKNNKRLPGKRGMGGSNTRRRPNNNNKQRRRPQQQQQFTNRFETNRNKNHNQGFRKKGNRRVNANLANRDINRKKTNKLDAVNQGTNTFTKTETLTQTGTANDEKDVNCIIIHKDPPTTQRPFWAILGRDANGEGNGGATAGRHFGKRKRVNLRLGA